MITPILYNKEQRSFASIKINPKSIDGFKLKWPFKGKIARDIYPLAVITCYKFTPAPSIYTLPKESKERELKLMNGLKKLCPEVPVIRARRLFNAFYIGGLDEYRDKFTEAEWKEFCREFGIEYEELMQQMGPHMVFLGDSFANAPTLAHEFGHYLNTIGRGEPGGAEAHSKYSKASNRAALASLFGLGGSIISIIGALANSPKTVIWSGGFASVSVLSIPLLTRPIIKSETVASLTGIKLLKKVGANEEEIDRYRKDLDGALGTYKRAYVYDPLIKGSIGAGLTGLTYLANKASKSKNLTVNYYPPHRR